MDIQHKKYKAEFEHSYTFGVFPTVELLRFRAESVARVLVSSRGGRNEGITKLEELCRRARIPFEVNDRALERLAPKENMYAIGVFRKYEQALDPLANHVVLVNPGDMGNLGTIIRTMLGFGMQDLALVRPAVDIFDPRAIRSSMGALFQMRFAYFDSFAEYRSLAPHALYPFMTNGSEALGEILFEEPFALIFGNESSGLSDEYLLAGTSVTIRHTQKIDSLSLPTAVGVALYEATRAGFSEARKRGKEWMR